MMATLIANAEIIAAAGAMIAVLAGIRLLRARRRAARAAGRYRAAATRADANTATAGPPHAGAPASPPPSAAPAPGVEEHRHLDDSDLKHLAARLRRAAERRRAVDTIAAQLRHRTNATGELLAHDVILNHGRVRIPLLLASPRGIFALAPDTKWTLEDCDALREAATALRENALPGYPGDVHCAIVLPDATGDGEPKQWFTMNGNQCWLVGGAWLDRWLDAHHDDHLSAGDVTFLRRPPVAPTRP